MHWAERHKPGEKWHEKSFALFPHRLTGYLSGEGERYQRGGYVWLEYYIREYGQYPDNSGYAHIGSYLISDWVLKQVKK